MIGMLLNKYKLAKMKSAYNLQLMEAERDHLEGSLNISQSILHSMQHDFQGWEILNHALDPDHAKGVDNLFDLDIMRNIGRKLELSNSFAINAYENRISYIVGEGTTVHFSKRNKEVSDKLVEDAKMWWEAFNEDEKWDELEQEWVKRTDRDGETFLRFFANSISGKTAVRNIDPEHIRPDESVMEIEKSPFGIVINPRDMQTVTGYINVERGLGEGELIDASEIEHTKLNVDRNVLRGIPTLFPVHSQLTSIMQMLKNLNNLVKIQTNIGLIRSHKEGVTPSVIENFRDSKATVTTTESETGRTRHGQKWQSGRIIDVPAGMEYSFPAGTIQADKFIPVYDSLLRSIAARLIMPEFMFTSNARNANRSTAIVAEGPAHKNFQRLQAFYIRRKKTDVIMRVLKNAIAAGKLPKETLEGVVIEVQAPRITTRDIKEEAEAREIDSNLGILSPQTHSRQIGLDYDKEQENIAEHEQRTLSGALLPPGEEEVAAAEETT